MPHITDAAGWTEAAQYYRAHWPSKGLAELVEQIAASRYVSGVWGWTSMDTLCLAQPPVHEPMSAPYLRISPLDDGMMRFMYQDAAIESRQWTRTVPVHQAFARLESFFQQLRWFAEDR